MMLLKKIFAKHNGVFDILIPNSEYLSTIQKKKKKKVLSTWVMVNCVLLWVLPLVDDSLGE